MQKQFAQNSRLLDEKQCNYSSISTFRNGYFTEQILFICLRVNGFTLENFTIYSYSWSWKDAEKLCRDIGGYLPVFSK